MPRLVLLVLFGNLGILWPRLEFGVPFDRQLGELFGIDDLNGGFRASTPATCSPASSPACSALALSEAAYMAEIVRAGIQSVDQGQTEAAARARA